MLMLLAIALPLAILGFAFSGDEDDEDTAEQIGTQDDDILSGTAGRDFIDGNAGEDVLNGRAGDDTIFGRDGDDVLQGEDGNDMLCSGDGSDVVTGNRGQDFLEGQEGDDFVSGDYGGDTVRGNEGDDIVIGGRGGDIVEGNTGDDLVFGGIIAGLPLNLDEMTALRDGGALEDLNGDAEMRDDSLGNTLLGGEGDDNLVVGSLDWVRGGAGADTFHIMSEQEGAGGALITDFNAGDDAITVIVDDTSDDVDITVTADGTDAVIRLGNTVLARIEGAAGTVSAADITLISEDTVESLFNPNALAAAG